MELKKRWKLLAIVAIILVVTSSAGFYAVTSYNSSIRTLVGFNADEAYLDMTELTNIGPRVPGTAEDLAGAEYVQGRFIEAGLKDVHMETHSVTTYQVNSASMALIQIGLRGPVQKSYQHLRDFVLYEYSGSTSGDVRLELVDVGNGTEEAFQGVDCQGKAILTTMQCLPRAAEHGAKAVIVQNVRLGVQYDYPPYSGGLYGGDSAGDSIPYPDAYPDCVVPTCSVSNAVGEELRNALKNVKHLPIIGATVQLQLNFDVSIAKNNIFNVVGDVKGAKEPSDIIYFIAHRDSTYISPGAVDDTSGTVTVMELARQLAKSKPDRTLRFISADAEEIGVIGATEYAKAHAEELKQHGKLCLNFDMNDVNIQHAPAMNIAMSTLYQEKMKDIRTMMYDRHPELQKYKVNITNGGGPDDGPFVKRGVPNAFAMGGAGSSWEYHTTLDTVQYVSKESWAVAGIMFGTLGLFVAGGS